MSPKLYYREKPPLLLKGGQGYWVQFVKRSCHFHKRKKATCSNLVLRDLFSMFMMISKVDYGNVTITNEQYVRIFL